MENITYTPVTKLDMLGGTKHKLIKKLNTIAMFAIMGSCFIGVLLNGLLRDISSAGMYTLYCFTGVLNCYAYIYIHELTHALAIIMVKREKPEIEYGKLAASCGAPTMTFTHAQYAFVASAPLVTFCIILLPLAIFLPPVYFPLVFMPLCYNVFGSMGDVYMIRKMLASPKGSIILDEGTTVSSFMPENG